MSPAAGDVRLIPRKGAGVPMRVRVVVLPGRPTRAAVRRLARAGMPHGAIARRLRLRPGFVTALVAPWAGLTREVGA